MKKTVFIALTLLMAVAMQAETVSFTASELNNASTSATKDGVTIVFEQGSGANAPSWNGTGISAEEGNTMTISGGEGISLESASFTLNLAAQATRLATSTWSAGSAVRNEQNTKVTDWTGPASSVTVTIAGGTVVIKDFSINIMNNNQSFTVTFVGADSQVLKTESVTTGNPATAPIPPTIEGHTFVGWDADFSNVTSDLTVHAIYEWNESTTLLIQDMITENELEYGEQVENLDYSVSGKTIVFDQGTGSNIPTYRTSHVFLNTGNTITVYSDHVMHKVVIYVNDAWYLDEFVREATLSSGTIVRGETVYDETSHQNLYPLIWEGSSFNLQIKDNGGELNIVKVLIYSDATADNHVTVTFYDFNGNVLQSEQVTVGTNVTPPTIEDECFAGWDHSTSPVRDNTDVHPVKILLFSLTEVQWNTQTSLQPITVNGYTLTTTGSNRNGALRLTRRSELVIKNPDYIYNLKIACSSADEASSLANNGTWSSGEASAVDSWVYWVGATDSLHMVPNSTINILSIASECQPMSQKFAVTFFDFFGNILKVDSVSPGENATAPSYTDACFTGWDRSFTNVRTNIEVHAIGNTLFSITSDEWKDLDEADNYATLRPVTKDGYTISMSDECYYESPWDPVTIDGASYNGFVCIPNGQTITISAPNTFKSMTILANSEEDAVRLATGTWSNGEAEAVGRYVYWYGSTGTLTFGLTTGRAWVYKFSINCITDYTVIFHDKDGGVLHREIVPEGGSATAPQAPEIAGYSFNGWNGSYTNLSGEMLLVHVYPIYEELAGYVDVTFVDMRGNELQFSRVPVGGSVIAPEAPEVKFHTFVNWDHPLTNITESMVIKPLYEFDLNSPDIWTVKQYKDTLNDGEKSLVQGREVAIKGLYREDAYIEADGRMSFKLGWPNGQWDEQIKVYRMLNLNQEPFVSTKIWHEGDTIIVFGWFDEESKWTLEETRGVKNGYVTYVGAVPVSEWEVSFNLPDAATMYDFSGNGLKQVVIKEDNKAMLLSDMTNQFVPERVLVMDGVYSTPVFIEDVNRDGQPDMGYTSYYSFLSEGTSYNKLDGALFLPNFDANGDGRIDYMIPATKDIMYQQADGTFRQEHMLIYSYDEYMAQFDETTWADIYKEATITYTSGSGLIANTGWSAGMQLSGACLAKSPQRRSNERKAPSIGYTIGTVTRAMDFNADGYIDLIDEANGLLYQNMGNSQWIAFNTGGMVQPADLNNDGFTDYIFPGKELHVLVYKGNGEFDYRDIYNNAAVDNLLYCYDFDKDGDIDILATFSTKHNATNRAYTCFFLNDGQGHFTRQTEQIYGTENIWFSACQDIDGDGYMDLLAFRGNIDSDEWGAWIDSNSNIEVVWLKGKANRTFENPASLYTILRPENGFGNRNLWKMRINTEDLDNDGRLDIWVSGLDINQVNTHPMEEATVNTAPTAPAAPTLLYNDGYLTVSWGNGSDAQTQTGDLTYALRIGTTPGGNDILAAHANADGSRRNFLDGNMGLTHSYKINLRTHAPATLYVAVQAIDAQHVGSAWSQEATVAHTCLPADFELSRKSIRFYETTEVHYTELPEGYVHTWNWDGGQFNGNELRYTTAGEKVITHSVTAPNGKATSYSLTLTVLPNDIGSGTIDGNMSNYLQLDDMRFTDLNYDGLLDVLYESVVYEGQTNPLNFTPASGLWNTQLPDGGIWMDWNRNGLSDLVYTNSQQYLPHQDNAPDMAANMVTDDKLAYANSYDEDYNYYYWLEPDLLHLGQPNIFKVISRPPYDYKFCIPNGNTYRDIDITTNGNIEWLRNALSMVKYGSYGDARVNVVDYNKDGWLDLTWLSTEYVDNVTQYRQLAIFENKGNGHFNQITIPFTQPIAESDFSFPQFADFNSDGYWDIYFMKYDYNNYNNRAEYVLWNNGNISFAAPEKLANEGTRIDDNYALFMDIDNNGYTDILTKRSDPAAGTDYSGIYVWYMGAEGVQSQGFLDEQANRYYYLYDVQPNRLLITDWIYVEPVYSEWGYQISGGYDERVLRNVIAATPNAAPQAPTDVRAVATEDGILIEWNAATDDHTSAMSMRYNLSVKHAGQTGAGAYVISPQNGGHAEAAYVPGMRYIEATRYVVPKDVLTAGNYEIMVQAIDQRNMMSAFSLPVTMYYDRPAIEAPATVCKSEAAAVTYMGGESGTPAWNFDGGVVESGSPLGTQYVAWSTAGMKTITLTMNGKSFSHMVYVDANNTFVALPTALFDGGEVAVTLPANMEAKWTINIDGIDATITPRGITGAGSGTDPQLKVKDGVLTLNTRARGTTTPLTLFNNIYITLTLTNANGCESSMTQRVDIIDATAYPQISYVSANADGHYVINWDAAGVSDAFGQVLVLKETNILDQFVEIGTVNTSAGSFVDNSSDASQKAERYAIRGIVNGGAMSPVSPVHQAVHMIINRGMTDRQWNLIWNQYSGADVVSYNILRGSSENALTQIASVAASNMSYSDVALDAQPYYAIEFVLRGQTASSSPVRRMIMANVSGRSNIVNSNAARTVTYATSLSIQSANGQYATTADKTMLLLYAEVLPSNTTYKNVVWEITSGNSLATIDRSSGLLTANTPNNGGTVTVKATTTDGTNVTATKQITIGAISDDTPVVPVYYTIRFENWNGTLLENISVLEGTMPVYSGATPTRPDDEQFTYTFTGWTPEIVAAVANATYTATYSSAPKQQGLDDQQVEGTQAHKVLINGTIYILRGDKVYTLTGQMVR